MSIKIINPTTGEVVQSYDEMSNEEVEQIIESAHKAFLEWKTTSFDTRKKLMKKAAQVLNDNADKYAKLMAVEMGKPIKSGVGEIKKCAWCCDFYADHAEKFLQAENIPTGAQKSYITFRPLGVVLAIMPWNFPFWQVIRFAAPALMAGNVGLLKHSENVTGCALALEELFIEAGFPENVFRTVIVSNEGIDEAIPHKKIAAVSITGSTRAGKIVSSIAGANVKKSVLELGGSDPYIVLEDADLNQAVELCAASRLTNSGQSCIAAKRFIVVSAISQKFEEMLVDEMRKYVLGDPMQEDTQIGPQARADLRDNLHRQVEESVKMGAKLLLGGVIPAGKGTFYPATVLANVTKGMPAYTEELFGPVAAIITVKDEEEAIKVANDSIFGLGAAVFTKNLAKGEDIAANKIESGSCFVNAHVQSDPRLPFGGIKESGHGRELSHYGIKEFVNIKSVLIG